MTYDELEQQFLKQFDFTNPDYQPNKHGDRSHHLASALDQAETEFFTLANLADIFETDPSLTTEALEILPSSDQNPVDAIQNAIRYRLERAAETIIKKNQ